MGLDDITGYLVLSYFSHTLATITDRLAGSRGKSQRILDEWLSSAYGVGLAFASGTDILADLGVTMIWEPVGMIATGILLGQGVKFGISFLKGIPPKSNPG